VLTSSEADARRAAGVDSEALSSSSGSTELLPGALARGKQLATPRMPGMPPFSAATPVAPLAAACPSGTAPLAAPRSMPLRWSASALLPKAPSTGCRGVEGCGGDMSTALLSAAALGLPASAAPSAAAAAVLVALAI
jgi:hypothetical protein